MPDSFDRTSDPMAQSLDSARMLSEEEAYTSYSRMPRFCRRSVARAILSSRRFIYPSIP